MDDPAEREIGNEIKAGRVRLPGDRGPGSARLCPLADREAGGDEHRRDGGQDLGLPPARREGRGRRNSHATLNRVVFSARYLAQLIPPGQGDSEGLCYFG